MKKNHRTERIVLMVVAILTLASFWVFGTLPLPLKSLFIVLIIYFLNILSGQSLEGVHGRLLFARKDFRWKKFILYDFESYPNIPVRILILQLASHLFVTIGIVLWLLTHLVWLYGGAISQTYLQTLFVVHLIYSAVLGGFLFVGGIGFHLYEITKYQSDVLVDIPFIK